MQTQFPSDAGQFQGCSPGAVGSVFPVVERDGRITVADLIDRYALAYTGRDKSRGSRLAYWRSALGHLRLEEVKADHIRAAVRDYGKRPAMHYVGKDIDGRPIFKGKSRPNGPATLNRLQACISAVFQWAIREAIAPDNWENPARRVAMRDEPRGVVRFLSSDERERLFAACKASKWKPLYALALLAITSGGRKGELTGLRWRDVDLEACTAHLAHTKNGEERVLVFSRAAAAELAKFKGKPDALVFASKQRPDKPFNFAATAWPNALKAAGVKRFRFHDLRHTCASYLAQNNATLLEIADHLGHKNLSVTRRYSHLTTGHRKSLVDRVMGSLS